MYQNIDTATMSKSSSNTGSGHIYLVRQLKYMQLRTGANTLTLNSPQTLFPSHLFIHSFIHFLNEFNPGFRCLTFPSTCIISQTT